VAVRDSVCGTRFYAKTAKNTPVVVDVIYLRVAVAAADSLRRSIFRRFDIDAIRRARRGAQETGHAFFQPVFVALQYVRAAEPFLQLRRTVRIRLRNGGLEHLFERNAHAFGDCRGIAENIGHDPLQVSALLRTQSSAS